jgi:hypothetical protein
VALCFVGVALAGIVGVGLNSCIEKRMSDGQGKPTVLICLVFDQTQTSLSNQLMQIFFNFYFHLTLKLPHSSKGYH